jgi:hypothetical protein
MAGIKALRKVQIGLETTAGTNVPATRQMYWNGTIEDAREVVFADDDIGILAGIDRTWTPKVEAKLAIDATATFEELPYLLSMAIVNTTAPTTADAGSGKVWSFPLTTATPQTISTFSVEAGDNTQAEEFSYGFVRDFKLSGAGGEAIALSANIVGRQVSTTSFTTSLTLQTVEVILFGKTKLYIDTAGAGTMGTTLKSNTLLGFDFSFDTGQRPIYAGDGQLYFSFVKAVQPEGILTVTFEHDGAATAEIADWRNEVGKLLRLSISGSALTTAGTTYTTKLLHIDLTGKWERFDRIGEQDGNDIVQGTLRYRYSTDEAIGGTILVVNQLAAL